jgi:hypothetical protein
MIHYAAIAALACCSLGALAATPPQIRAADSFDRSQFHYPDDEARVRAAHNLSGGGCCTAGWVEYDFDIRSPGWHGLIVHGNPSGVEFLVDPDGTGQTAPEARFLSGSGQNRETDRIGNVWLTKGVHRVRVQRHYWSGFPSITAIELKRSDDSLAESIAIAAPEGEHIYRKGQCPALEIVGGGLPQAERLGISEGDPYTFKNHRWHNLQIPASATPTRQRFALPCYEDGYRILWFADSRGSIPNERLRGFFYQVVDTEAAARLPSIRPPGKILEIDCAKQAPDYSSGGATRVVNAAFGSYRESGETGLTRYQRAPQAARKVLSEPSWFAYTLDGLAAQQRYRIEIDYPDDALRTFAIAMREAKPLQYPVAIGVDTGGEYSLSSTTQTQSMVVWPRAGVPPRLTFVTAHDGLRAACTSIRVYRAEAPEPLAAYAGSSRQFMLWYEEGANYASLFGPDDDGPRGQQAAAERWAEAVTAIGGSTLMPTVSVYSTVLYPSRHNVAFSQPNLDQLRRLLLVAEKYRLKVVPELHPRADELTFGSAIDAAPPANLAVSREGKTNFVSADGKRRTFPPHYNALAPDNQEWYVAMVGELADRYKDSPALEGISLRHMAWANPALNNLVNLDWGYDDVTVTRFKKETGSAVPLGRSDDPNRFAARHAWLTGPGRQAWIDWRCRNIADLIRRIRDRVRSARPDLKLYLDVFGEQGTYTSSFSSEGGATLVSRLRESGLDPAMLNAIDGVVLLNASYSYGRREADGALRGFRDMLLDPASLNALRKPGDGGRFLSGSQYLEATEVIVPPGLLGFPADTKQTWMSAVTNAAGRHALERYAVELAATDALTLGDGGNGYVFGPPIVREFMANFRRLPARPFSDHADAVDPVTVRSLADSGAYYFYAVNRERYPVSAELRLSKSAAVTRLADGQPVTTDDGRLPLELRPYELIAFKANGATRIEAVRTHLPEAEQKRIARQIAAVEKLADLSPLQTLVRRGPSEKEIRLLQDAVGEARKALDRGWLWRARTVLEHSALLAIYKRTGCFPPELRDGDREARSCED